MDTRQFQKAAANQLKRIRTRALLMDSAIQEFARNGIDKTSIDQIVWRAEVSHGTFYYHFAGKQEIADAVGRSVAAALVNLVDGQLAGVESGPERVALATQLFLISAATIPDWGWLVVHALADMGAFRDQISRGIRKDVLIGIRRGEFDVQPSELLFTGMLSVVGAALRVRLDDPAAPELEREAATMILMILGCPRSRATSIPVEVFERHGEWKSGLGGTDPVQLLDALLPIIQQVVAEA